MFFIVFSIFILALFLRLYKLSDIPPGVNRDEASIGYTAYSLLQTGRDEYGKFLPISFQSFGDWKLPLYIYITIPFVALFGLTESAIRLPSAIAGVLTVLLTFFLVLELFKKSAYRYHLSIISSLLLAISPWHIHLSRVESESNIAVFLVTLATLFFLYSISKITRLWLLMPSFLFFALTYFTYHGNHIFTTLYIVGLLTIFRKNLSINKPLILGSVVFITLVGFILSKTLLEADQTKISGISIFGDPTVIHTKIELPRTIHDDPNSIISRVFHNRPIYALETVAQNYLKAFSVDFLFIKGGGNRAHNIENFGNMYLIEAPFLLLGLVSLVLYGKNQGTQLLVWWLLIAPIAASITKDAPHTNRMFAVFPALSILVALGISFLYQQTMKRFFKYIVVVSVLILYGTNFSVYLERYYIHFPKKEAIFWGMPYKQITQEVFKPENQGRRVIINSPERSPYIYIVFYSRFSPRLYQQIVKRYPITSDGFIHIQGFDRFVFKDIDWSKDVSQSNTLIVDFYKNIPEPYKSRARQFGELALVEIQ